ncbi:MAG TPA: hypothetical protein VKN76_04645 [Kiloniellaceae bacterium]|nr:hypothetical protein [Kiloniellaceae bacterium]
MAHRLILSAGISRSGSTWLYNAARLLLESGGSTVAGAWIEDHNDADPADTHLVKLHDPNAALAEKADLVLTSRRDLRDIAASIRRMKWAESEAELLAFLDAVVAQHAFWSPRAGHEMVYEAMIADGDAALAKIARVLGLATTAAERGAILAEIDSLRHDPQAAAAYDKVSLLHHGHRGEGAAAGDRQALPSGLIARIEQRFGSWLSAAGYL